MEVGRDVRQRMAAAIALADAVLSLVEAVEGPFEGELYWYNTVPIHLV